MTKDCKDRIWMYSVWIAWGCSAIPTVWSDAIPYGGALSFAAWLGGFLFASALLGQHLQGFLLPERHTQWDDVAAAIPLGLAGFGTPVVGGEDLPIIGHDDS